MSSGGAPTPARISVFAKHNWDVGRGIYGLMGVGIYHLMGGAFMAYRVGHLSLNGGAFISLNGWGIYDLMGGAFVT